MTLILDGHVVALLEGLAMSLQDAQDSVVLNEDLNQVVWVDVSRLR